MNCYSCQQPAINACKRCAKPYCEEHGNATYCAGCLRPASALPSFNLYRGALLVMLVGTAVAVFLVVRPPGETKGAPPVVVGKTTATPSNGHEAVATRTPQSPGVTGTPSTDETPPGTPRGTTTPGASATSSPFGEYTVVAGDTLFDIANANLPPGDDPVSFAKAIAALNGLNYDAPLLPIGKKLLLPKPRP